MFRLLTILMLVASSCAAQELPVAPPASSLGDMVNQAIFATISAFLLFVINYAKKLIATHLKKQNHDRGVNVIKDALYSALDEENSTLLMMQSDKNIKEKVNATWLRISMARLNDLYGFNKPNLEGWIKEQQSILLGKLANGVN